MLKRDIRAGGHSPLFLPTLFLRSRHLLEIGTRASRTSEIVLGRKSSKGSAGNKSGERTSASIKSSEASAGNKSGEANASTKSSKGSAGNKSGERTPA